MLFMSRIFFGYDLTHKKGNRRGMKLLQFRGSLTHKKSNHKYKFGANKYGGFYEPRP